MTFNEYKQEVEKENGECQILHSVCDHNEKNCGKTSDRNAPKNVSWIDYWRAMTENYSNTLVCSSCIKYRIHDHNTSRPENIYNLKTHGIVTQYSSDVQLAMELGLISNDSGKRLEKKILLYEKDRNLAARKAGKPRLIRGWYRIQQKIIQKIIKYI